jgi:hypothetical protein
MGNKGRQKVQKTWLIGVIVAVFGCVLVPQTAAASAHSASTESCLIGTWVQTSGGDTKIHQTPVVSDQGVNVESNTYTEDPGSLLVITATHGSANYAFLFGAARFYGSFLVTIPADPQANPATYDSTLTVAPGQLQGRVSSGDQIAFLGLSGITPIFQDNNPLPGLLPLRELLTSPASWQWDTSDGLGHATDYSCDATMLQISEVPDLGKITYHRLSRTPQKPNQHVKGG